MGQIHDDEKRSKVIVLWYKTLFHSIRVTRTQAHTVFQLYKSLFYKDSEMSPLHSALKLASVSRSYFHVVKVFTED